MQKRAKFSARRAAAYLLAVLICSPLAAGLAVSVSFAGRGDRGADALAEQVAPASCEVQQRSPAGQTSLLPGANG